MDPSALHHVNRDQRAADLAALSVDFQNYISDAYKSLAGAKTQRVLRALRHGVTLAGIESALRAAEWVTAVSPENGVPFKSRVWNTFEMENGVASLEGSPYRIIGARTSNGTSAQPAEEVTMKDALINNTRWLDVIHDRTNDEIIGVNNDSDYTGTIWVPEQRFANPAIRKYVAQAHQVRLSDIGANYPPPHLFYLTRLIEQARQQGLESDLPFKAAQAVFGAPFAYAGGTIEYYSTGYFTFDTDQEGDKVMISPDASGSLTVAIIKTDDGDFTASFLPNSSTGGETELKDPGTTVQKYEPLVTGGSASSIPGGVDRQFGAPESVVSSDRSTNTLTLDTTTHGFSGGDRAALRVLNQDYKKFVVVESVTGADVTVRGEIGSISSSDWAYLAPRSTSAAGGGAATLSVSTPFPNGDIDLVQDVITRIAPAPIAYSVSIA
jgi:hypothetical protein